MVCDIEIPSWSFVIPRLRGGTELIHILCDPESPYLPLSPDVHEVGEIYLCNTYTHTHVK